jgi:hypothetical protein
MGKDVITFCRYVSTHWHWPSCRLHKYTSIVYPICYNLCNSDMPPGEKKLQPQLIEALSLFQGNVEVKWSSFVSWQDCERKMLWLHFTYRYPFFSFWRNWGGPQERSWYPISEPQPPKHEPGLLSMDLDIQRGPLIPINNWLTDWLPTYLPT